jgi:hypothetical protein
VTSSFDEVRAALALVAERLAAALGQAATAREQIADAVGVLSALEHTEPLVPPELRRAGDELERSLQLISGGAAAVADIDARL